jgi:hypothetical protein
MNLRFFYIFRIIGALSLMSTLFIGVAIMAKIDSDKWQAGRYVIVLITLNYSNFEMQSFLEDQDATFSPHKGFDSIISTVICKFCS